MEKDKPKFYCLYKDFNSKELQPVDVLACIWPKIPKNKKLKYYDSIKHCEVQVSDKETLKQYLKGEFQYHYWSKCEWEFIVCDWPHRDTIEDSHPIKVDVYDQIKPNLDVITNIVWKELYGDI